MNGSIMWSCECGNDNFLIVEDIIEDNCLNEVHTNCEICGQCVTLNINVRVLPRDNNSIIKKITYRSE